MPHSCEGQPLLLIGRSDHDDLHGMPRARGFGDLIWSVLELHKLFRRLG